MDTIIADRTYDQARHYIQECISKDFLSEEVKNKLVEFYGSLTVENAKTIYDNSVKLYGNAVRENRLAFDSSMYWYAGIMILSGLVPVILCQFAKKYVSPWNRFYRYVEKTEMIGTGVLALGLIALFSIGH